MWFLIERYAAQWNLGTKEGWIHLELADGTNRRYEFGQIGELQAVVDLLRNEKPAFINVHGLISTSWEPVGEQEG